MLLASEYKSHPMSKYILKKKLILWKMHEYNKKILYLVSLAVATTCSLIVLFYICS